MKRVLYASNGAGPARQAGALLRRFADPQKVRVTVNVCESVEFAFAQEGWSFGEERKSRPQPAEVAETELAALQADGFEADTSLGSGPPELEKIKEGNYDIALLGAGSTRWLDNFLLAAPLLECCTPASRRC
ncbi:MAG TPA: hypothetical protein VEU28_08455 [Actinomycetota bacterium]|nr:hypothetical protein [Actinomycetota bacterium]